MEVSARGRETWGEGGLGCLVEGRASGVGPNRGVWVGGKIAPRKATRLGCGGTGQLMPPPSCRTNSINRTLSISPSPPPRDMEPSFSPCAVCGLLSSVTLTFPRSHRKDFESFGGAHAALWVPLPWFPQPLQSHCKCTRCMSPEPRTPAPTGKTGSPRHRHGS